ncbi:hypothetical protein LptCag_0006 [Leptospirillum ferriphilum]|uniref:Uncharacterized protein n=1 Tax=Leptospirillum ferriphilum TaxID=178606 RepID=A0A094X202_9BACT|nr:hypothetical protein LptCag_0006 [Leptospirillum ferriphilum]
MAGTDPSVLSLTEYDARSVTHLFFFFLILKSNTLATVFQRVNRKGLDNLSHSLLV